ncbi:aliphatic sulfonate ABC transporter substrate-binding protein, partial [Methylobacterium sp. A54F]
MTQHSSRHSSRHPSHHPSRRALLAAAAGAAALAAPALVGLPRPALAARSLRTGYQRSSTLIALLRQDGSLEAALAPPGASLSWHEFTSGLPIMEALNAG